MNERISSKMIKAKISQKIIFEVEGSNWKNSQLVILDQLFDEITRLKDEVISLNAHVDSLRDCYHEAQAENERLKEESTELGELQMAVYHEIRKHMPEDRKDEIDGAGSDAGPIEFTVEEVRQGFGILEDVHADRVKELQAVVEKQATAISKALNVVGGFYADPPHVKVAHARKILEAAEAAQNPPVAKEMDPNWCGTCGLYHGPGAPCGGGPKNPPTPPIINAPKAVTDKIIEDDSKAKPAPPTQPKDGPSLGPPAPPTGPGNDPRMDNDGE